MRIPKFKRYTLINIDGWPHEVSRHDHKVDGKTVHTWCLKDGRKLEPTEDSLVHRETNMLFVRPEVYDDEDEPD
jgi:hypothetical protein